MSRPAEMACRILLNREVRAMPVNPLAILRDCRDTAVMTFEEAAEYLGTPPAQFERLFGVAEAFTLQKEGRFLVAYRPGGNPARLRFTLAHELGHRALGHTGKTPAEEHAADAFASHLLCPRPAVVRLRQRFPALTTKQLAAAFYVSDACAAMICPEDGAEVPPDLFQAVDSLLAEAVSQMNLLP